MRNFKFENKCDDEDFIPQLPSKRLVYRKGMHIFFYDDVDSETQYLLYSALRDCEEEARKLRTEGITRESITLHIKSYGGDAYAGTALYDLIRSCPIPVATIVEGIAASAASDIFLAGDYRYMLPNSMLMIHQVSWGGFGDNRYMQDSAKASESLMDISVGILMEETELCKEYKDEAERAKAIRERYLEHDTYLTYAECEKYGIIREEEEPLELNEDNFKKLKDYRDKLINAQLKEEAKAIKEVVEKAQEDKPKKTVKKTEKTEKTEK